MAEPSRQTIRILDLGEGLDFSKSPANLAPGSTISADNWVMREGGIAPRPGQAKLGDNPPFTNQITGGSDIVTSEAIHFQLVSSASRMAYLNLGAWTELPWVATDVDSWPPNPATTSWWVTQSVRSDGSVVAFMAPTVPHSNASGAAVGCWLPGEAFWSTLSGNVPARAIVSYSNYLIFWSTGTFSGATYVPYPTRVQWSDRGNCLDVDNTTGLNLAGFEDLLDARGGGTGAAVVENKIILFTEEETWQGVEVGVPGFAQFQFAPLDRSVGCRRPQTIQTTPEGVMFVGQDNYIYLIPKSGGQPALLSKAIAPLMRGSDSAWAVYNVAEHRYELYATVPSTMSAEPDCQGFNVAGFTYTSAQVAWTNRHFGGGESIEVWQESAAGWSPAPVATVQWNGYDGQYTWVYGLTSDTTYRFGTRAVKDGQYTSGYSTVSPANWEPSAGVIPYTSVMTTTPLPDPGPGVPDAVPNAPTNLVVIGTVGTTSGTKGYVSTIIEWTPETLIGGLDTEVYRSANTTIFNQFTSTLMATVPSGTTQFETQPLLTPPNAPPKTDAYAVRHRNGFSVSPFSNQVTVHNPRGA